MAGTINYKKMFTLLKAGEKQVRKIIIKELTVNGYEPVVTDDFIYAEGTVPVMLLAHWDTVPEQPKYVECSPDGILSAKHGLGADDRAGIYAILELITKHHCSVLFTGGEERGGVGARAFTLSGIKPDVNYCIQLDRRGENDAVYYDCANDEFEKFVTSHNWKSAWGTFTDICEVAPYLGVAAVNLSVGYSHEHTDSETLDTKVLRRTIDRVPELLNGEKYEYVENDYYLTDLYNGWVMYEEKDSGEIKYAESYGDTHEELLGVFFIEHPDICFNDVLDFDIGRIEDSINGDRYKYITT